MCRHDDLFTHAADRLPLKAYWLYSKLLHLVKRDGSLPSVKELVKITAMQRCRLEDTLRTIAEAGLLDQEWKHLLPVESRNITGNTAEPAACNTACTSAQPQPFVACNTAHSADSHHEQAQVVGDIAWRQNGENVGNTSENPISCTFARPDAQERVQNSGAPYKELDSRFCTKEEQYELLDTNLGRDGSKGGVRGGEEGRRPAADAAVAVSDAKKINPNQKAHAEFLEAWTEFDDNPPSHKLIGHLLKDFTLATLISTITILGPRGHLSKGIAYFRAAAEGRGAEKTKGGDARKFVDQTWEQQNIERRQKLIADIRKEKSNAPN